MAAPKPVQPGKKRRAVWPWLLILLAVMVVVAIVAGSLAQSMRRQALLQGCNTPETCLKQADQLIQGGNPGLALPALNQAIDLVPPDQHPPYAQLVCRRGELNMTLKRKVAAVHDFEQCSAWTENHADLQHVRDFANQMLKELASQP